MCSDFNKSWLACLVLLCSCSVLENREECPCRIHLDLSDPSNYVDDSLLVNLHSGSYAFTSSVESGKFNEGLTVVVPGRGGIDINVVDGQTGRYDEEGSIVIPYGEQCPRAYLFHSFCKMDSDQVDEYVRLHKNYCGVSLSFSAPDPELYELKITGNICGYSREGLPSDGEFCFEPRFTDSSVSYFRIPRQKDASLRLGIASEDGYMRYFALGSYIEESGYDWMKEDLEDITVTIDYAASSFHVSIDGWEKEISRELLY